LPGTLRSDVDSSDTYLGGDGNDWLWGNKGIDNLKGGAGDDVAYGGAGNDEIHGDEGDDVLAGDEGGDILDGCRGGDTYVLKAVDEVDTLLAGTGNATHFVDGNEAVLIEYSAEGVETVEAIIGATLGVQFEGLTSMQVNRLENNAANQSSWKAAA
jgi:Ca2+-binding RTX toxin-like protein